MTGMIASGIISVLTKKYQQKLKKIMCLIDIITPALVIFERVVSCPLKNGVIDEEDFNTLQTLHLETLNELTGIDHRMEAEHRSLVEKDLLEEVLGQKPPRHKPPDKKPLDKAPLAKNPKDKTPQSKLMNTKYILHK